MRPLPKLRTLLVAAVGFLSMLAPQPASSQLQAPSSGQGCPVEITARQRAGGELIATNKALAGKSPNQAPNQARTDEPSQGLSVELHGKLRIVSAEIVVHALSPKSRVVLTSGSADADIVKTFHLVTTGEGALTHDLWMAGASSIRRIELKSLTYSDGSIWNESPHERCSIAPDPFVLVATAP